MLPPLPHRTSLTSTTPTTHRPRSSSPACCAAAQRPRAMRWLVTSWRGCSALGRGAMARWQPGLGRGQCQGQQRRRRQLEQLQQRRQQQRRRRQQQQQPRPPARQPAPPPSRGRPWGAPGTREGGPQAAASRTCGARCLKGPRRKVHPRSPLLLRLLLPQPQKPRRSSANRHPLPRRLPSPAWLPSLLRPHAGAGRRQSPSELLGKVVPRCRAHWMPSGRCLPGLLAKTTLLTCELCPAVAPPPTSSCPPTRNPLLPCRQGLAAAGGGRQRQRQLGGEGG